MNGKRILSILGLLILLTLVVGWIFSPRVIGVEPQGVNLHGRQPITISFTQPMDEESVESGFSTQPQQAGEFDWNPSRQKLTFTPHGAWPSDTRITVKVSGKARSSAHLPLLNPQTWELTVSPYLLTYLYPADEESNLYSLNVQSGESHTLTEHPHGVLDYDVSPDGLAIYYSTVQEDGTSSLYILDRENGDREVLITCNDALCRNPRISPHGDLLAYQRIPHDPEKKPQILLYDVQSQTTESLSEHNHYLEHPAWSSAGWLAYYDRTDEVYAFLQPEQDNLIEIPNETGAGGTWSPDGKKFLTTEILDFEEELAPRHLFVYDMRDGSKEDLTEDPYLEDANPSYSPRGDYVAFARKSLLAAGWTPGRQLWIMDETSNRAYSLTKEADYHHTAFTWHPNGDQLAYVRYNQAQLAEVPEIWLMDIQDDRKVRLVINGFAPSWIP